MIGCLIMSKMATLAIIGGGVAGLCAAHKLQDYYNITLFEASADLGGNNHSAQLADSNHIPMGVILFPDACIFPQTHAYARQFNLPLVSKKIAHIFYHQRELQYTSDFLHWPKHIKLRQLGNTLQDIHYLIRRFVHEASREDITVRRWMAANKLSEPCIRYLLLPAAGLYLSMPYNDLFDLPICIIAQWWKKYLHPLRATKRFGAIEGGNQRLIHAFIQNTPITYKTNTPITRIQRDNSLIKIVTPETDYEVDKVLFAIRPDEALRCLDKPTALENILLQSIDVGEIMSTLHRNPYGCVDDAMTLKVEGDVFEKQHLVSTWHHAHFSSKNSEPALYISIHETSQNPINDKDIEKQIKLRIPFPTVKTLAVIDQLDTLNQQQNNTYFCGSYFNAYFYHEDAIASAVKVAEQLMIL